MSTQERVGALRLMAAILWRCVVFSVALLMLWFLLFLLAGDLVYNIHSRLFELSRHDFDLMNYYGMAFLKVCGITFFLFPWIAIHLVIRTAEKGPTK